MYAWARNDMDERVNEGNTALMFKVMRFSDIQL
jgi:hypothetical protein